MADPRQPNSLAPQQPRSTRPASVAGTGQDPNMPAQAPAGPGPMDRGTQEMIQNNALYDPNNPQAALRNAMRASGINAFSGNPFIRAMLQFAPGLATAFLGQNSGTDAADLTGGGQATGDMFKSYLTNAIKGGGGMSGALRNFSQSGGLNQMNDNVNKYRNQVFAGEGDLNPFAAMLDQMLSQSGGPASMMSSLSTPFMAPRMGQAYGQGLNAAGDMALGQLDPTNQDQSIFGWLLGQR